MKTKEYEFFKAGLLKKIVIKEHQYDLIEFTIYQKLTDENGKVIIDSKQESYFTSREFKEFFTPLVNDLKERFDNDTTNSIQE
jgi:hypothetical protein